MLSTGAVAHCLRSLDDGSVQLFETLTGEAVALNVNTTGGFDSLTVSPIGGLKENTSYTLLIDGFQDRGPNDDPSAPTREFEKFSTSFTTGDAPDIVDREVAFVDTVELDGSNGAGLFTSVEMSPDGSKLYVSTLTGEIKRWDVDPATGEIDAASEETFTPGGDFNTADGRRGIIGLTFDPENADTIWITDNYPIPLSGRDNGVPDFSGRISKVTLGTNDSLASATIETYASGFPRSNGDHVTNSLEFRANPDAGQAGEPDFLLYLIQGSNSAMGAPDTAWGQRPERLMNAAVMEIDHTRTPPPGGFDVATEPLPDDGNNRRFADPDGDLKNGGIAIDSGEYSGNFLHFDANGVASVREGADATSALVKEFYNPFEPDAVVKIFATGPRNAYDLVWHSNGFLYVPTNGSAAGGNVPDDPDTPQNEAFNGVEKQDDYLFRVVEGQYYGHPNPLHDQFILNGGNPTSGVDPNQVNAYPVGTQPDPDYDLEGAYSLGESKSPNGAIEYTSDVFGASLQGAVLFTEYSGGNDVRAVLLGPDGTPVEDFVLQRPNGSVIVYPDPLDVIQGADGRIYVLTLNRGTGESQLIRLEPAPGGVVGDNTADEGGDLALVVFDASDPSAVEFQVNGLDSDILTTDVSFDGGTTFEAVTLDGANRFVRDFTGVTDEVVATLRVGDDDGNSATASTTFTPGEEPGDFVTLLTIQAEDDTPGDGTAVTITPAASGGAIQIRDANNLENPPGDPDFDANGFSQGLRAGAFGVDGNTDNTDGVLGGYADYGSTNADFMTFSFDVAAANAGDALLQLRYANGGNADRPLEVVVNGAVVGTFAFAPTPGANAAESWSNWQIVEVSTTLVAGANTVTLNATANTGPNIDQLEVLVPTNPAAPNDGVEVIDGVTYTVYEAENAALTGAAVATEDRNQRGDGFVDFVEPGDDTISWTVSVAQAGTYDVDVIYALSTAKAPRPMALNVNGDALGDIAFVGQSNAAETDWFPQSLQLDLVAGLNTITFTAPGGVGPNVDYLRINTAPIDGFMPDYVPVDGEARIELEQTADDSTRILNANAVEFFFTVAEGGAYAFDLASNSGAPDGGDLTLFLNGEQIATTDYPGVGDAGEATAFLSLEAGVDYALRVVSSAPGANEIDYLDVRQTPSNVNADIEIQSLDPAFYSDRLHFSFLLDDSASNPNRVDKETAVVEISNTGTEALEFFDASIDGFFSLADPAVFDDLVLQAGQSIQVTVRFDGADVPARPSSQNGVVEGALTLRTNDAEDSVVTIDLAGFWQARDEGGQEPNLNEVWQVFGFGNTIQGLSLNGGGENSVLNFFDVYLPYDVNDTTEILSPYWRIADGVSEVKMTQIAAFHGIGGSGMGIHNPAANNGANDDIFWFHSGSHNQRVLPLIAGDENDGGISAGSASGNFATVTFTADDIPSGWIGNGIFGIEVNGLSTNPSLNPTGSSAPTQAQLDARYPGYTVDGSGQVFDPDGNEVPDGYTVRVFQALDADGNEIPNVYLGVMDFTGINYDYNDNMFVIEGITPVGYGGELMISGLDDAAADDRLVFTNIDNPANAQQEYRNEATITLTNVGIAPVDVTGLTLGGDNAAGFTVSGGIGELAPGASVDVTVTFVGSDPVDDNAAVLFNGTLTVETNGQDKTINLAGLAQVQSESGEEPTVAQIVEAFGYSTDMAQGLLANGGVVETVGDEVLIPYMQALDPSENVEVINIAAFLQQGDIARLNSHSLTSSGLSELYAGDDQQGQTVLPDGLVPGAGDSGDTARASFDGTTPFGLKVTVDGRPTFAAWSDPDINLADPAFNLGAGDEGHYLRYFQAKDGDGNDIPGTFIAIQDYPGGANFDYNDHMYVIRNVQAYDPAGAEDANSDGIIDALQIDSDSNGTFDFFDLTPDTLIEEAPAAQAVSSPTPLTMQDIARVGTLSITQDDGDQWTSVTFEAPMTDPAVIMGALTSNDGEPATLHVRNVTPTGFEFQVDEWDSLDGAHGAETVSWMAVEKGVHELGDGTIVEAGSTLAGTTSSDVTYAGTFAITPVVLGQVVTTNEVGAVATRLDGTSASGFSVLIQEEEGADNSHADEQVDWVAVLEANVGGEVQTGTTGAIVTGFGSEIVFDPPAGETESPALFAAMQSLNEGDAATVRLSDISVSDATLFIEEETSADAETTHAPEDVGWMAFYGDWIA